MKAEYIDHMGSDTNGLKLSYSDLTIIEAVRDGYTADEYGFIYNKAGKVLSCKSKKKAGHLSITFKTKVNGFSRSVLAHRFIAYFFFGVEVFKHQCVRHLNGIPFDNSLDNIALGSFSDNRKDIPFENYQLLQNQNHIYWLPDLGN